MLGEGKDVAEVVRHLKVTESTYHRWRNQFAGMNGRRRQAVLELERKNSRLQRIVAEKELEIDALR